MIRKWNERFLKSLTLIYDSKKGEQENIPAKQTVFR